VGKTVKGRTAREMISGESEGDVGREIRARVREYEMVKPTVSIDGGL
jgi:hypothetical protein